MLHKLTVLFKEKSKLLLLPVYNFIFLRRVSKSSLLGMPERLSRYISSISVHEPKVLEDLRLETARDEMRLMQVPPEEGQFLYFLVKSIKAKKALELGVYTGYSSIWIALGLPPEGKLIACDINENWASIAERYWRLSGTANKIDFLLESAENTLRRLLEEGQAGTFDFIFIDADKPNYILYYEKCLELLSAGGVMAIDNVLLMGGVLKPKAKGLGTATIRRLNELVFNNPSIDVSLIPMADGITLIRKKG